MLESKRSRLRSCGGSHDRLTRLCGEHVTPCHDPRARRRGGGVPRRQHWRRRRRRQQRQQCLPVRGRPHRHPGDLQEPAAPVRHYPQQSRNHKKTRPKRTNLPLIYSSRHERSLLASGRAYTSA
ncbi:Os09g0130901 [Oryza sativa Japonica Group]|uniref:Os09g0130901 protein n=1 Tax=Oryza sativa subsp. japonica TaxID=39947 RepID=A0A0P0XJY6_ORYSJ|nr:hypothetical protein EE612_046154 [Oryza sativa]BAT06942.1 Os09g0130901 [Oryza sativa Japonica Group]